MNVRGCRLCLITIRNESAILRDIRCWAMVEL
nr:MAG TPA: hypothetical protein [Caudoviricetes sp.]